MAPVTHQNTITPNSFKFLIGPEQRPHFLRSGAVAGQSRALDALVNGSGTKEQNERSAVWTNVDEPTFLRFSQFVYTGDYAGAEPSEDVIERRNLSSTRILPLPDVKVYDGSGGIVVGGGGRTKASSPWINFALLFPDDGSHTRRNGPTDDYSEVFLSHARIYFLAEYYDIAELQALAVQKLHRALVLFTPYRERVGDLLKLIRFCYEDGPPPCQGGDGADLKKVVSLYAAVRLEDLWPSEEFQALVEMSGEFSRRLVRAVLTRLAPV